VVKNSEIFPTFSQINLLQDLVVACVQKKIQKFGTSTRNGNFGAFFGENTV